MRRGAAAAFLMLLLGAALPDAALASPPPPPPEYIGQAATILAAPLTRERFDAYAALLAPDLKVFVNQREAASDKATWLAHEQASIGKIQRIVIGRAEGMDDILVVDEYDDRSDVRPGTVADPRFVTRAARYQFGPDHRVHELHITETRAFFIRAPKE